MDNRYNGRALISFDMDGVICRPPFGVNVGISRRLNLPPLPQDVGSRSHPSGRLAMLIHGLRYFGRRPVSDARAGLLAIGERRRPVLVTARDAIVLPMIEGWLRRHGLRDCFHAVHANDTALRAAHFKLHKVRGLGAQEHVDDDGATVYYLARHGFPRVYLRDWPGNRGLPYPPNVQVVRSLLELADLLAEDSEAR